MSCKTGNCKESIFQNQSSVISTPQCQDNCPEQINCNGEIVSSDCVKINANLDCLGIVVNDSLTDTLQSINDKVCDIESGCKVKVSANDACCEYLGSKITSTSGSISITTLTANPSNCQTLDLNISPASTVWNNLNLTNNFSTISGWQIPQYSEPDALGRIWFRGSATVAPSIYLAPGSINNFITAVLGLNYRPTFIRTTFNGRVPSNSPTIGSQTPQIIVNPNGMIQIKNTTVNIMDSKCIICFDGFVIEKS